MGHRHARDQQHGVGDRFQVGSGGVVGGGVGELELGVQAGLVGLGQLDLVLLGEQRVPPHLIEIDPEQVERVVVALHGRIHRGWRGEGL